ncbi:amino acid ABC transporter permease [Lottiidibacillus patelloidae]|uniref:Amino acid ABC transporter permease n=1 Tax=Lottiidibacillus patelloidae TaxID=2670334 RepID=A0A263BSL9_9BACI|nr:amino acid ABC transporter permease [Lottiidibacillus patelloidae]OZM56710.1 amino acid ABC transporter permease [Lottiidibacillus patelloidae]
MSNLELNKEIEEVVAPPKTAVGFIGWMKQNLFSSWFNTILTIISAMLVYYIATGSIKWIFFEAEWRVVTENFRVLMVGRYPVDEIWRIWAGITFSSVLLGLAWGLWRGSATVIALFFAGVYFVSSMMPFIANSSKMWLWGNILLILATFLVGRKLTTFKKAKMWTIIGWTILVPLFVLLLNGLGFMKPVPTSLWGGFLLTLLIALISIVVSFPFGILLALGRKSNLPVVKWGCIIYIEFIRGVPLITLLFVAQFVLPLFLGASIDLDNVLRAMIGFTMFSAAYLAENIRGGLQSIPNGQYEAAQAVGLNKAKVMAFVVMPQALRAVIPAMVGQFIGIFKDTSLVTMVGLSDILNSGKSIVANIKYLGLHMEVYVFIAFVFFLFCYLMSYTSRRLEKSLGVGER